MSAPRDPLARALDALRPPPAPPSAARVWDAVRQDTALRTRRRRMLAVAAGLMVGIGASLWIVRGRAGDGRGPEAVVVGLGRAAAPETLTLRRAGAPVPRWDGDVAPLDDHEARDVAALDLASGATLAFEPGARVEVRSGARVVQRDGRVRYDVRHDPRRPFTVVAAGVEIVDVGTRFAVDVTSGEARSADGSEGSGSEGNGSGGNGSGGNRSGGNGTAGTGRVLVTVEAGEVTVGGRRLGAGRGLAVVNGRPAGDDWPVDARPVLALDVETSNPRAGGPVVCRVTLRNPTDAWLPLPSAEAGGPVWLEVTGPDGVRVPVRVTASMRLPPRNPTAIPPRGEAVVRVQFERTFASPGAYRLRAVYRPADAVEPPRSPEALLTVR